MGICPQIQSFLTFQTILFFLTYSHLSWYVNYRKKLVAILNAQPGGCVPQSTCRACAVKILKRWVQKIAGVPPLYSAYSLIRGKGIYHDVIARAAVQCGLPVPGPRAQRGHVQGLRKTKESCIQMSRKFRKTINIRKCLEI